MTAPDRAISAHGLIGDLHTAALVAADGTMDWCCAPRFDSPSLFASLLDHERGGHWRIAPVGASTSEQHYLPATNVLRTEFNVIEGGVVHLTDFMPVGPSRKGRTRVLRGVRVVRGQVPVTIEWAPRFDYARRMPSLHARKHGVLATDRVGDVAAIAGPASLAWTVADATARATVTPKEGETLWFVLTFDEDEVHPVAEYDPDGTLEATTRWWDAWTSHLTYTGPYRREVERSALALKLCCYEPTGAIIAAPTTSLPEAMTGGRNWDYRYAWLRDSAFVLNALDVLGFEAETDDFLHFLKRVCRHEADAPLQIMFAVDGKRDLSEHVLEHLSGWRGVGPVRIGNGAARQFQLDVYGEVLETVASWLQRRPLTEGLWKVLRDLVNWTAVHWHEPDLSIWEPRIAPRHHVFSKVMAWVALDRGARIALASGHTEEAAFWRTEAEAVHAEVLDRGWDPLRRTFVQCYGEPQLDAALFILPQLRFLPPGDPRIRSTLEAIRRDLATSCEDLVYRYRNDDGFAGVEGAFVICSFWMIQTIALVGDFDEAERLFRNLLRRANGLGLMAEEIDPATGEHMGNFPQGLSHASLINTAHLLERLRAARPAARVSSPAQGSPV